MKKEISAETKAGQSTKDEVTTSNHTISKPIVIGSALSEFINENLQKSKEEKWSNKMFGSGWIAALMHVKVNFIEKL